MSLANGPSLALAVSPVSPPNMEATRKQGTVNFPLQVSRLKSMVQMHRCTEVVKAAVTPTDLKRGLPPIARADAKLLILGSLPGDASLAAAQYYAHPRNHFWELLGGVIGQNLNSMDYSDRITAVQESGIALWDVIGSAHRAGSLDHHIRNEQLNDLRHFAKSLPELRAVAFNGKKAGSFAGDAFDGMPFTVLHLPSSSPAYTLPRDAKAVLWARLTQFVSL